MSRIIPVDFSASTKVTASARIYQYDRGDLLQIIGLDLPDYFQVHFANDEAGVSVPVVGTSDLVEIPEEVTQTGDDVLAYVYLTPEETTAYTDVQATIKVSPRAALPDGEPDETQQSAINRAIAALNIGVADAQAAADQAAAQADRAEDAVEALSDRVSTLDATPLIRGAIVDAVGIPMYVDTSDLANYAAYGLTETGWYIFACIMAGPGTVVTGETAVTGAAGYVAEIGADHVDVAVRMVTAAKSVAVTVSWGQTAEIYVFRATDLAIRNLDYRTTFYIYDAAPYATWTYGLTTDATFVADKAYFTKDGDVYTPAEVTAGEAVPADTYYEHTGLTFEGMPRNVTFRLDPIVDCPITIILPEVAEDGHGAWFEIQTRFSGSFSVTLQPPEGVKVGTAQTQAQTAGINTIDLQYTSAGDVKMWTLLNTHANIPT